MIWLPLLSPHQLKILKKILEKSVQNDHLHFLEFGARANNGSTSQSKSRQKKIGARRYLKSIR